MFFLFLDYFAVFNKNTHESNTKCMWAKGEKSYQLQLSSTIKF